MTRSEVLCAGISSVALGASTISAAQAAVAVPNRGKRLELPKSRRIRVAFALGADAAVIDFAGLWEVFGETMVPSLGVATTHHAFSDRFAKAFPKAHLVRGARYVENEHVSSAGGLSSGSIWPSASSSAISEPRSPIKPRRTWNFRPQFS